MVKDEKLISKKNEIEELKKQLYEEVNEIKVKQEALEVANSNFKKENVRLPEKDLPELQEKLRKKEEGFKAKVGALKKERQVILTLRNKVDTMDKEIEHLKKSLLKEQESFKAEEKVLKDGKIINVNNVNQKQSQLELKNKELEKLSDLLRQGEEESKAKDEILEKD